ncbi:hypothetical protein ZWY2020_028872 [Hordeum vulgare]|nr:hypothetical protein ZWY2020_028872 [Hordeum vulgare]
MARDDPFEWFSEVPPYQSCFCFSHFILIIGIGCLTTTVRSLSLLHARPPLLPTRTAAVSPRAASPSSFAGYPTLSFAHAAASPPLDPLLRGLLAWLPRPPTHGHRQCSRRPRHGQPFRLLRALVAIRQLAVLRRKTLRNFIVFVYSLMSAKQCF